jgi:hypothetical protein
MNNTTPRFLNMGAGTLLSLSRLRNGRGRGSVSGSGSGNGSERGSGGSGRQCGSTWMGGSATHNPPGSA